MKKVIGVVVGFLMVGILCQMAGMSFAVEKEQSQQPAPFETVKIVYETLDQTMDRNGNIVRESKEKQTTVVDALNGKAWKEDQKIQPLQPPKVQIFDGQKLWSLVTEEKQAVYSRSPYQTNQAWKVISWDPLAYKAIRIGEEQILGRPCIVYAVPGAAENENWKFWVWKGIYMKGEVSSPRHKALTQAVSFEQDIPVNPEMFLIPEGFVRISQDDFKADREIGLQEDLKKLAESFKDFSNTAEETKKSFREMELAAKELSFQSVLVVCSTLSSLCFVYKECPPGRSRGEFPEDLAQAADSSNLRKQIDAMRSKDGDGHYHFSYVRPDPQRFQLWVREVAPGGLTIYTDETQVFRRDGPDGEVVDQPINK